MFMMPAGAVMSQQYLSQTQFIKGCAAYRESVIEGIILTMSDFQVLCDSLKNLSAHPEIHDQFRQRFLYMVFNERYWGVSDMIEKSFPGKDPDALKKYLDWGHRNRFKLHELNVLAANKIVKPEKPFQLNKLDSFWKEISAYHLAEGDAILDMGAGNGFLSFILSLSGLPLEIYASEIDPDFRSDIFQCLGNGVIVFF